MRVDLKRCLLGDIAKIAVGVLVNIPQALFLLQAVADIVAWYAQGAGQLAKRYRERRNRTVEPIESRMTGANEIYGLRVNGIGN